MESGSILPGTLVTAAARRSERSAVETAQAARSPTQPQRWPHRPARLEWLRIVRFRGWARFLVLPMAGIDLSLSPATTAVALARGVVIAFLLLAFGYLANALGDRAMDRDSAKNPLVDGCRDEAPLKRALALLATTALLLSATGSIAARIATPLCLASGWAYSLGPRWKRVPVVGTLMNILNFAPLLFVGIADAGVPTRLLSLMPAFAALLVQNQLLHEAADAREDRAGSLRTTFLHLGASTAARLAALGGLAPVLVAIVLASHRGWSTIAIAISAAALFAPFVIAFPILLALRGGSPEAMARVRVAQRWSAMAAGILLALLAL